METNVPNLSHLLVTHCMIVCKGLLLILIIILFIQPWMKKLFVNDWSLLVN